MGGLWAPSLPCRPPAPPANTTAATAAHCTLPPHQPNARGPPWVPRSARTSPGPPPAASSTPGTAGHHAKGGRPRERLRRRGRGRAGPILGAAAALTAPRAAVAGGVGEGAGP